jgi:hypothetical protein
MMMLHIELKPNHGSNEELGESPQKQKIQYRASPIINGKDVDELRKLIIPPSIPQLLYIHVWTGVTTTLEQDQPRVLLQSCQR